MTKHWNGWELWAVGNARDMKCMSVFVTVTAPHVPAQIQLPFYDLSSASECFHSKQILQAPCLRYLNAHIQKLLGPQSGTQSLIPGQNGQNIPMYPFLYLGVT